MLLQIQTELTSDTLLAEHCPTQRELMQRIGTAVKNSIVANTKAVEAPIVRVTAEGSVPPPPANNDAELAAARCEMAKALAHVTATAHRLDKILTHGR